MALVASQPVLGGTLSALPSISGIHRVTQFFQFSSRVIVAHIVTYIGVGVLAFMFVTREFFDPHGIAAQIMRTPVNPSYGGM